MKRLIHICLVLLLIYSLSACEDKTQPITFSSGETLPFVEAVDAQPLVEQVKRLTQKLNFLGSPLPQKTVTKLEAAYEISDPALQVRKIQEIMDPLCLVGLHINPESRVKVQQGMVQPKLYQLESRRFLIKIRNEAGVTSNLNLQYSPGQQSEMRTDHDTHPKMPDPDSLLFYFELYMSGNAWMYNPQRNSMSGLDLEYAILNVYCGEAGKREATLTFDVGQGTQDLGFRSELPVLFTSLPTYPLNLSKVRDESGETVQARFVIRDSNGHIFPSQSQRQPPDFWFHAQIYRTEGQMVRLPDGKYEVICTRGPEYLAQTRQIEIRGSEIDISFELKRWIDPSLAGYWSGDHHIHAAGCAHYTDPTEGVLPKHMLHHILGEDLKVGSVLTWGPGFDYQKQFFTGETHPLSKYPYTMRYDVEVSGFGSHQSGHLCLLRLGEQMYPGGDSKDHWPTLGLNTLRWAQKQGAVCGPAHSGFGIKVDNQDLPNYEIPPYNSIGANEYVVDVTHMVEGPDGNEVPAVDFMSAGDTWPVAELNMWYHTLNCGFRTRISGETDFPCITGARVGVWRSYVKLPDALDYDAWCEGISRGSNYVSDGKSHLMHFKVNQQEAGEANSELKLSKPGKVRITVDAAALLEDLNVDSLGTLFLGDQAPWDPKPWGIEKARLGDSNEVKVEV
ncbi:MAG: CehA/McbA family metallohydrolase, partial [Cyclobacteriaceae bacterium]|nr:CehA/McbA family metallohydrolase [Cyclobacteriaceae bacterium]